jgi:hypothetical protein
MAHSCRLLPGAGRAGFSGFTPGFPLFAFLSLSERKKCSNAGCCSKAGKAEPVTVPAELSDVAEMGKRRPLPKHESKE